MVIDAIAENGLEIESCRYSSGYYLFEFGENSVANIVFKCLKNWRWGVWVINDDEDDTKHTIYLFGEHVHYIDKFKPTAVKISREVEITDAELLDKDVETLSDRIWEFVYDVKLLLRHRLGEEYRLYGEGMGFLQYTFGTFFDMKVRTPFRKFREDALCRFVLKCAAFVYRMRFRRRFGEKDNNFHVNVSTRERGWWPRHVFQIVYEGMDEDEVYKVYHKIHSHGRGVFGLFPERTWLIPDFVDGNTRVTDSVDDDDVRGFYYRDAENKDALDESESDDCGVGQDETE